MWAAGGPTASPFAAQLTPSLDARWRQGNCCGSGKAPGGHRWSVESWYIPSWLRNQTAIELVLMMILRTSRLVGLLEGVCMCYIGIFITIGVPKPTFVTGCVCARSFFHLFFDIVTNETLHDMNLIKTHNRNIMQYMFLPLSSWYYAQTS